MTRPPLASIAHTAASRLRAVLLAASCAWVGAACAGLRGPDLPEPGTPPEARPEPETPTSWYWAYVANSESDVVSRIRFGPAGAASEKTVNVGVMPDATDRPLDIRVSPDGRHWYLTTSPGRRVGRLFRYETGTDRLTGSVRLGSSPGSVDLTPDGREAWVAHPGARGAPDSAALAVVRLRGDSLREVARVPAACGSPRSSRVARSGDRAYVTCAGGELVVEIDAAERRVVRALRLDGGAGEVVSGDRLPANPGGSGGEEACGPGALETRGDRLWVACSEGDEVLEIDGGSLRVRRRLPAGVGPAALAVTPEGSLLLAANREGETLSVVHLGTGREMARLETSRPAPRGIAVSDDSRYAFVANASGGMRRSTVDVFDLVALARVAEVEVEHGAAAVAFWRSRGTDR